MYTNETSSEGLWLLRCMWRTGEGIQLDSGLGMVEMRSVGVFQCVSECRVTVYCVAFIGVSLSLLTVELLIGRLTEHI
jgi:hypothetical protein